MSTRVRLVVGPNTYENKLDNPQEFIDRIQFMRVRGKGIVWIQDPDTRLRIHVCSIDDLQVVERDLEQPLKGYGFTYV